MVSAYKVVDPSLCHRTVAAPPCFAKLAYSYATFALSQRCRSRSARAVRPASLAANARHSACRQALAKARASCTQACACHARKSRWLRPCRFSRSSFRLGAFQAASSLATFEATMPRHANAFKHQASWQRPRRAGQSRLACSLGARPRKSRNSRQRGRWFISRLTLPSSGPAFGGPLKSNVRRRWSRRTRSSVQGWVTSLSRRHLALRSSPTRTQLLLYPRVAGHGRLGPSVPLRWRPAHGIRSAISLRSRLAPCGSAWACRASKTAGFVHAGLAIQVPSRGSSPSFHSRSV